MEGFVVLVACAQPTYSTRSDADVSLHLNAHGNLIIIPITTINNIDFTIIFKVHAGTVDPDGSSRPRAYFKSARMAISSAIRL